MKIALVHDCFREYGGAERVVEAMHELWPDAPVYTSFVDWKSMGKQAERFKHWDIRTSWVQHWPFIKKYISPLRFLIPSIWKGFDFSSFDVVITSSGWFMSRGAVSRQQSSHKPLHICYIHHPPRNMYGYATGSNLQKYWLVRVYSAIVNFFLRHYDFMTAQHVDYFIANSKETARRVRKFYRRESSVIYPPIDIKSKGQETRKTKKQDYYLSVGRFSWSKRIDVIIQACNELKVPLKIVGMGKEEKYLMSIAGPTVQFLGSISDEELHELYAGAKALLFCALDEDFGMVPVEAMAHGVPVIALSQGGVKETVVDGVTGVLFSEPTIQSLIDAIQTYLTLSKKRAWSSECLERAKQFSKKSFQHSILDFINNTLR